MQWVIYSQINTLAARRQSGEVQIPELKIATGRIGEVLCAAAWFGDSRESPYLFSFVN